MYSVHNEEKSVVAERFMKTLKTEIYKYMTLISKDMYIYIYIYINKLDDIINKYNNTSIVQLRQYQLMLKIGDHERISKYKKIFAKGYTPNWSEKVFVIKKITNAVPWTYFINDLNGEEIVRTLYENELQKTNQEEFRIEKVIKKNGDKLYVKWKGYDSSFNSWIDRKDLIK